MLVLILGEKGHIGLDRVAAAAHGHAGHMLDAAGGHDIGVARGDFHEGDVNGGHGRPALLIYEFSRNGFREVGQKNRNTTAIGPLLAHTHGRAHDEVVEFFWFDTGSFQKFRQHPFPEHVVGAQTVQPVPAGVPRTGAGLSGSEIPCDHYILHDCSSLLIDPDLKPQAVTRSGRAILCYFLYSRSLPAFATI